MSAVFSFRVVNGTNQFTDDQIFLLAKGKRSPTAEELAGLTPQQQADLKARIDEQYFSIDGNGVATLAPPRLDSNAYACKLSTIGTARVLTFPNVISGRMYISIGQPVLLELTKSALGSITLADPDAAKRSDLNYPVIYDKVEFTLDEKDNWFLNTTAVDFLAMPISISGQVTDRHPDGKVGLANSRKEIFGTFGSECSDKPDWKPMLLELNGQPLRIIAPNKSPDFPANYLDPAIAAIWTEGDASKIAVDCSEVISPNGTFTGQVTGTGAAAAYVFSNDATTPQTVSVQRPTSNDVFGCAGALAAEREDAISVIAKNFGTAMNLGLLPRPGAPDSVNVLSMPFFTEATVQADFYQPNAHLPSSGGPFFNLYSKILHSFQDDGKAQSIYAFAFDDHAGQDSTLSAHSTNQQPDPNTPLQVTIHDMQHGEIPVVTDPAHYDLTIQAAGAGDGSLFPFSLFNKDEKGHVTSPIQISYATVNYELNLEFGSSVPELAFQIPSSSSSADGTKQMVLALPSFPKIYTPVIVPAGLASVSFSTPLGRTGARVGFTVTAENLSTYHLVDLELGLVEPPLAGLAITSDASAGTATLDFSGTGLS